MMNLSPQLNGAQRDSFMGGMHPEMEGQQKMMEEQPHKIVAHFSKDEFPYLDEMQGGEVIDPLTGLRDYTPLEEIVKIPEIHDAILASVSEEKQRFATGGQVEELGRPTDPELERLRLEGRNGDTELAIITPYLLEFFSEMAGHEPQINPQTGLPEFFSFKNFFKSAVRVVGAMLGPIGGFAASKLTGQSTGAALKNAFIGAALPMMALAPAMGGFGGSAGGIGGLLSKVTGAGAGMASGTGGGLISNLAGVGRMLPGMGQAAGQIAGQAGLPIAAGQQAGGGLLGGLLNNLGGAIPMAASALMLNKGRQQENKAMREYELERRRENEAERKRMGFDEPLHRRKPDDLIPTDTPISQEQYETGSIPRFFHAKEGGAIRGNGKGQQDNIQKDIKENSYIIDASTVSDLGDGSTQAGIKELDNYFSKVRSHERKENQMTHKAKGGYIKAMVSNGEYEVPPEIVTSMGQGSNEKGAKILEKLIKQVRAKKRTSGSKLPPKSKPIGGYLKQITG